LSLSQQRVYPLIPLGPHPAFPRSHTSTPCSLQGLPLATACPQNLLFTPDGAGTDGQSRRISPAVLVAIVFAFFGQLYFAYFLGIVAVALALIALFTKTKTPTD
jgi:hypothetical protein